MHAVRPNRQLQAQELQAELMDALKPLTPLDVFWEYGDEVARARFTRVLGHEVGATPDMSEEIFAADPHRVKRFYDWWRTHDFELLMKHEPLRLHPSFFFDSLRPLPPGSWFMHHTNKAHFDHFDRGAVLEGLHLSTFKTPRPVRGDQREHALPIHDRVYIFAYEVHDDPIVLKNGRPFYIDPGNDRYGRNTFLFQSDAAVRAYHHGDEEYQSIVPVGTEYNTHWVEIVNDEWEVVDGDEQQFATLDEMLAALAPQKKRRAARRA